MCGSVPEPMNVITVVGGHVSCTHSVSGRVSGSSSCARCTDARLTGAMTCWGPPGAMPGTSSCMDDPRDLAALEVERDYQQRLQRIRNDPEYQRRLQMIRDGEVDMSPPDDEEELPAQEMSGSGLQQDSPYETTFAPPEAGWVSPLDVCLGCLRWAPNTERCLLDARVVCIDCYNNGVDHRVPAPLHAQFVREQARRTLWSPDVATPLPSPPTPPADPRRNTARAADAPAEDAPAEDASAASGWQLWDFGSHYSWRLGGTAHTDVVPDEDVPARHSY